MKGYLRKDYRLWIKGLIMFVQFKELESTAAPSYVRN